MNNLFTELKKKGYEVHNKRILGNPEYTSEETKQRDLIQEYALIIEWLRVRYHIWTGVEYMDNVLGFNWKVVNLLINQEYEGVWKFNTPTEAYFAAFDYILKELI